MNLVDGGVTDAFTNTVTISRIDAAPFSLASIGVLTEGVSFFDHNEFVDFTGNVQGGNPVTQRVAAAAGQGLNQAELAGFNNLTSLTFRLQGETGAYQSVDNIVTTATRARMVFDKFVTQSRRFVEDGIEVSTDGTLISDNVGGPAIGTGSRTDVITIRPSSGVHSNPTPSVTPPAYQLAQTGIGTAPSQRTVGGWDGNYVRLTHVGEAGQAAAYASDQVLSPWTGIAEYAFDFRSSKPGSGDGADGWGWALLNTANFGSMGSSNAAFGPEPNLAGSLGIGFDTFDNGSETANSVSIHFAGSQVISAPLTSSQFTANPLESGNPLRAAIKIRPDVGGSKVTVRVLDLVTREVMTPITDHFVTGLMPYEARIQISAATSGAGLDHDIDNIVYQYDLVRNNNEDQPTTPVVKVDDFETASSANPATTNNSAMALYSLDVTATAAGAHQIDFDVTYLNGITERVTKAFNVAEAGKFQTLSFPELNR
ncbi:MAG: hypothetical protein MI861_20100, partial [Pirellulales bacterium]|nr:hypothetical protein [Pirellulales bacterium]